MTTDVCRIAMYSHDAMGIGHVRRNLLIARALGDVAGGRPTTVLLISGVAEAGSFSPPPGVDFLTLPSMRKDPGGAYHPRRLGVPADRLLAVRSATIAAALAEFDPHVLIVDKLPRGVGRELDAALDRLTRGGRTRCVLGLRDVLDAPDRVIDEWRRQGHDRAILTHYDAVWVYGSPAVYDVTREYALAPAVAAKVRYTGYFDYREAYRAEPAPDGADGHPPAGRYVLCMVGGGEDGALLAEAFARAERPAGVGGVLVTGPFMPTDAAERVRRLAAARPGLQVLGFSPRPDRLLAGAERVIAMGGYNTVWEVLSYERPALIVPRVSPRREQQIRAERLRALGLLDAIDPAAVTGDALGRWMATGMPGRVPARDRVDMGGVRRLPGLLEEVLSRPRDRTAAVPPTITDGPLELTVYPAAAAAHVPAPAAGHHAIGSGPGGPAGVGY